jgi:tRNA(Ile)-lysidine synthase
MIPLEISTKKNLLAFSAGIDSTALFFILIENNIPFDIAIVDYKLRDQSYDEVIYAHQLALKYNKQIFLKEYPKSTIFSEKSARDFRHSFFEELIDIHHYESLLTAHQLNDKLEWFLMQLSKGAGLVELMGMNKEENRDCYKLLKPLLEYSKDELLRYLNTNNHKYFIDQSNTDEKYKRNFIRHKFSNDFLDIYSSGVKNSFQYLDNDLKIISPNINRKKYDQLTIYDIESLVNDQIIRVIDKDLKSRGLIISSATRTEIINQKDIIVSERFAISISSDKLWIAPYHKAIMDKKFKDRCRINKIPTNIRPYLFISKCSYKLI